MASLNGASGPSAPSTNGAHVPPPAPSLNGGLYTGTPFAPGAPWANLPATPDAGYMNLVNLQSAGPPPLGPYHLPGGGLRPGNNTPLLPEAWTSQRFKSLGLICIPPEQPTRASVTPKEQTDFRGHAYLRVTHAWRPCSTVGSAQHQQQ